MCSLRRLPACVLALLACCLFGQPLAQAANNIPIYFDTNGNTAGFYDTLPSGTYSWSAMAWSNETAGISALTTRDGKQFTFGLVGGAAKTDFSNCTITIKLDTTKTFQGLSIPNTNTHIRMDNVAGGSSNDYLSSAQTWTVAAGSSFTEAQNVTTLGISPARGLNYSGYALTLAGGGTFNFEAPIGFNSAASSTGMITENGVGLVVNLKSPATTTTGGVDYGAGFTLTNGTLNFATTTSANAFKAFTLPAKPFAINGGILDNTSGSAMTLTVGSGGYSIGGDFTFTGSSNLGFGTSPVVLAGSPGSHQITVAANTLTIGGIISGSGFGLTKAGNGTLMLNGVNTYDGLTTISAGTLGGSGSLAGAATFASGGKAAFTVTPGGAIGNNSTVMKIGGVMTFNATEIHLNLPANLPGGSYALAYSDATPVAIGTFPTPVIDSGSFASDVSGATISVDTVAKQLVLTAATAFTGPVQLEITQINGGTNPTAGAPFDVVVQSQNGSGVATNVLTDTFVNLSLKTGSGTLDGTSSVVFPAGTKQAIFTGVTYSKAQSGVVLEATAVPGGDSLTPAVSTPFTVTPAAVSASASTIAAYPSGVPANGTIPITITVTLWDAFGNPISGKTVALSSDRGPSIDTISPSQGTSDASGVVTFTLTSTTPGSANLSTTEDPGGANLLIGSPVPVSFTTSNATLVVGEEQFNAGVSATGPPSPIGVVSGDLLEMSGVMASCNMDGSNFGFPMWDEHVMRNGQYTDTAQPYQITNPCTLTYALDMGRNPLGYSVKEIRLFSGWGSDRTTQSYDILYSLVGAPDTFMFLGTVLTPTDQDGAVMTRTYDSRAGTTPDVGPAILTGVAKIRFNIRAVGYGAVWHEIDVTGAGLGGGPTHNISGTVTLSGSGLAGVSVSDGTSTATTAADGTYTITGVSDGSYTVTPTLSGYSFNPASLPATVSGASVTGMNFTATSALPYDTWKNTTFAHAFTDTLPGSDPDGDGMTNFQEFAFGLDPTSATSSNPITQQLNKATGTFKYTRWKDSALTYIYQSSTTLSDPWNDFTPDSAVSNSATPVEEITVTVPSSLRANPKLFLRVKAE